MHKTEVLDNGLKIVTKPMPHMESVSIGIWLRAGGRYESKENNGISHLLEHLLFKGTNKRDMIKIKHEIEGRGGSFNGFTSEEHTCYLVKVLAKDIELGIDILSDMVLDPKLSEDEIEKEKSVIVEEISMHKDMPSHYVREILAETMWPDQPLGMPLAGTTDTVRAITRDEIVKYKEDYYNPRNMLIIGTGHITEDEMVKNAEKYLSMPVSKSASRFERATKKMGGPFTALHKKETEQTHLAIGLHAIDRFHPDRHVLSLLNIIMGANMSSRLFHIVRDEMALCYEISSSVRRYEDCGSFVIGAGVDDKKLSRSLEVILRELARIKKEPVGKEELDRAKEYYRGQLLFALEDTMTHMLWLGEKVVSGEKDFSVKTILDHIASISAADVMRAAQDMFKDENLNLAVIGPIKEDKTVKEIFHIG